MTLVPESSSLDVAELDQLQLNLKAVASRERFVLKRQLDSPEDEHGASSTLAFLGDLSSQIGRLEEELYRLQSLRDEAEHEETGVGTALSEVVLQTKTIPTEQLLREWGPDWLEATQEELTAVLQTKKTLPEITQKDVDAMVARGTEVLRVPMMLVFTIKAISARRKYRIMLCGNALPQSRETTLQKRVATYAGGIDIGLLRFLLAEAAKEQFQLASWDVNTAFLNAPAQPRDLRAAHRGQKQVTVSPQALWLVELAMYGLDTSPRDWSLHRTDVLHGCAWWYPFTDKSQVDSSVWYIMVRATEESDDAYKGWLAIYVDDFLGGSDGDLVERVYHVINATWECGELERMLTAGAGKAVRFDGLELQWNQDRSKLFVHQASYAEDLVSRYHGQYQGQAVPMLEPVSEAESEEVCPTTVRKFQPVIGELLYLSVRTRPDLAYTCSRLAAVMTRRPKATYEAALGAPRRIAGRSVRNGLQKHELLEIDADASFAPECKRSQEATVVYWRGLVIHWSSARQAFIAQSTCDANELVSTISGANLGRVLYP